MERPRTQMAPPLIELLAQRRILRQRFWEIEVLLAIVGIGGLASTMVRQDNWLLWSNGVRADAVVLEIEDTDEPGDKQYWIRVGDHGIWVIDDEIGAERGDELDVLFDPEHRMRAAERRSVQTALLVGVCAAGLPVAWLLVGCVDRLRSASARDTSATSRLPRRLKQGP